MFGRLFAFLVVGFTALLALSSSDLGDGARAAGTRYTAERARQDQASHLERQRVLAAERERVRRYQAGEMGAAERAQYEAELAEAERQRRLERQRAAAAAAAAARARSVRGTRSSGGGFSSGK